MDKINSKKAEMSLSYKLDAQIPNFNPPTAINRSADVAQVMVIKVWYQGSFDTLIPMIIIHSLNSEE